MTNLLKIIIKQSSVMLILFCGLSAITGCSLELAQIPHEDVENWPTFDPNEYGIEVIKKEGDSTTYKWSLDGKFNEDNNRIPYWKNRKPLIGDKVVKGYLNGKPYPVIFDTGANPFILLSERLVTENDLPVLFFDSNNKNSSLALVLAGSLKIGSFELTDYPCALWEHKGEFRMFGIPVYSPDWIIFPLDMMRLFSYFKFDDIQDEISFSKQSSFKAEDESEWLSLAFRIEGIHLLLDLEIEGIETTLMLDTGADYELELDESIAQMLFEKRPDFAKARKKKQHYYGPYADGKTTHKRFAAKNICFAGQMVDRLQLHYGGSSYEQKTYQGTIGLNIFEKTVMVLDFEKNRLWIKKNNGSLFEG